MIDVRVKWFHCYFTLTFLTVEIKALIRRTVSSVNTSVMYYTTRLAALEIFVLRKHLSKSFRRSCTRSELWGPAYPLNSCEFDL